MLERQTEPVREFLLETSVLERLSGGLCDAVTGRNDGQAMLEQVERANLFLVPLDEVRGWWRYHQLFADLLRARLQRQWPERVDQLHRDAAGRAEAHGLVDDAVRHALAADPAWAAHLVEQHADGLLVHSEGATLQRCLAALPAELVGARPRLCLAQARLAILGRRVEGVDALLDAAEHTWEGAAGAADPFEPAAGRTTSLLANVPATIALQRVILAELRGDADQTMRFASRTLTLLGGESGCWPPSPTRTWPWPSGCAAGCPRPSAPSPPTSPSGGRAASRSRPCGAAASWPRSSAPGATWTRPWRPLAYLGRLARAFAPDPAATDPCDQAGPVMAAGLVEPLSQRELEVLRLLASGKPNQQIAEELVVALDTVKKHVGHILSKLGAANRTEASARARELGLLR